MRASQPLAAGFAATDEADWHAAVTRFGKGAEPGPAPLSDDGIPIGPIHRRRAGAVPVAVGTPGRRWRIMQRVAARDPVVVLARCRDEMAGGADGVVLVFDTAIHAWGGGIPVDRAAEIAAGLRELQPPLLIDAGPRTPEVAAAFVGAAAECSLAFDPLAAAAAGRLADVRPAVAALAALAGSFAGRVVLADGRVWHAAGASEAQELAAVLATVIDEIRQLGAEGVAVDAAATRIGVALAADADQFLTIAKLRAARLLLARALEVAGIDGSIPIHAETAWRMMSRREPRMNVLRATGAAFAAAVGSADSIAVLPFDGLEDGGGSAAARRLARTTQLVIAEECQLFRFADPSAGSGAVEALTDALAEKAWTRFQAIEAAGGMLAALASGGLQDEIAATREARLARVAARDIEMIGVNAFVAEADPRPAQPSELTPDIRGQLVFKRLAEAAEAQA